MSQQVPLDAENRADTAKSDETHHDGTHEIAPDLAYIRLAIVNVVFYGSSSAGDGQWVLIDAGIAGSAESIASTAEQRYGKEARPAAIIQTHGHFDHVGALEELSNRWDVPVYAHELELPYLNGKASYPAPDPTVGGGMMATLSRFYPCGPVDVSGHLHTLPKDGSVPGMPGWQWIHTPGHTPGHISLWRETDRTVIAGDAFITTAQESAYAVAIQSPEMHGPPMYFTPDWHKARTSVRTLAALEPDLVVCGHGRAMQGPEMKAALHTLADDFKRIAVPDKGKYVTYPATAEDGTAYVWVKKS